MSTNTIRDSANTHTYRRGNKPTAYPPHGLLDGVTSYARYEGYIEHDVEWLGPVPQDWAIRRFKFLSSITTGARNTEDKKANGAYPFYVRSQTPEKIDSYSFDGEAILTAGDGAGVGEVYHYVTGKFDFHQRVYKFSNFKEVIGSYLFRYISINFYNVAILGTAKSTVDSLRLPMIQDFPVCFPSDESEQKAIATFLDKKTAKIDQAIKIKEQQIALLKKRKQIIIQQAVTCGLNPDAPMKDSGVDWIGEIPAHWEIRRNSTLFSESKAAGNEELPILSVSIHSGVSDKELSAEENIRSAIKIENKAAYKRVEPGYVAYNMMRAWQGGIGVVSVTGMVSPAYVVAAPLLEYSGGYFELLYRTPAFIWQMNCYSKGITDFRKRLYWDEFKCLLTIFPPVQEQEKIVDHIAREANSIHKIIDLKGRQIEKLKEYKTTLVNAAVTGKIKVT